jgi:hypothetical protein
MYLENNKPGDAGYIGAELITTDLEREGRYESVEQAVQENYFPLKEALSIYKVTEMEYLAYLLLKTRQTDSTRQKQLFQAITYLVQIFQPSVNSFDKAGKEALQELILLTQTE